MDLKNYEFVALENKWKLLKQIDKRNCGVFIVSYVDELFCNQHVVSDSNMQRNIFKKELLKKSLPVFYDCLICGCDLEYGDMSIGCDICRRWFCLRCLKLLDPKQLN
jgi:hypothetical protein